MMEPIKKLPSQELPLRCSPQIDQIKMFFRERDVPSEEAELFFFYFESMEWRTDSDVPILDWKAAARQWIWNLEH